MPGVVAEPTRVEVQGMQGRAAGWVTGVRDWLRYAAVCMG